MTHTTETAMLPFKVQELAEIIMDKKRLSLSDALLYLYNSELYDRLIEPAAKMWYESGASLYEQLEAEKAAERDNPLPRTVSLFLIFCMEQYRQSHNISSIEAVGVFERSGLESFLIDNFEALHSQSDDYILHEIELFLKKHR